MYCQKDIISGTGGHPWWPTVDGGPIVGFYDW